MSRPQAPLDVREAYEALEEFARDYGRDALLLLMHASVPETLTAELLALIRANFLPGLDTCVDADVLFSPLATAQGGGYYRLDAQVRWHGLALLRSLYRDDPRPRARRVAELLWHYVERMERHPGLDPLRAEFLAVQRWVALAFLEPQRATRAFADALKEASSTPAAAVVRLGGLAAAIELPLAGEQELLAYARGLDALATGDVDTATALLGSLGDDEIRVGDVVLKAPTTVLAEHRAAIYEETKPKASRKQCVVLIGFGKRTDPISGRVEDLDRNYALLQRALTALDFDCERLFDLVGVAAPGTAFYQKLLSAELVVGDISVADAEVAYLLGVSFALRPAGTIFVANEASRDFAGFSASGFLLLYLQSAPQERLLADLRAFLANITNPSRLSPVFQDEGLQPPALGTTPTSLSIPDERHDACLVLHGLGRKTDATTGRMLDLDASYPVIHEAVTACGLNCVLNNEFQPSPVRFTPYQLIRQAALVIADLSTAQPEVIMSVGIRHGLHPLRTILIAETQFMLPAALQSLPLLRYVHLGDKLADIGRLRGELIARIKTVMKSGGVDSPVYLALPTLQPPQPSAASSASPPPAPPRPVRELTIRRRGEDRLHYLLAGEGSAGGDWEVPYQPPALDALLPHLTGSTASDPDALHSLARILLPRELAALPAAQAYRLTVGRNTAELPWELLLGGGRPVSMIRRLDGLRAAPRSAIHRRHALLIGNPQTAGSLPERESGFPPLPGVTEEIIGVAQTLRATGFEVMISAGEDARAVLKQLYARDFELLLISGNSVREYLRPDGRRVTGFVLGDGIFLTALELTQMRVQPGLVFLNGCHSGYVGAQAGRQRKGDPGLAAEIVPELLKAGARCVIAPGWGVDDRSAALFAQRFFGALASGRSFEEACLAARQAAFDAAPELNTWAAFQAWGEADWRLAAAPG